MAAPKVVLIVVDNPAHRVLFNRYFQKLPHHLVFAGDGEDGFDRFAEVKPHLVIAHANAARLDGIILCQLIRQQPGGEVVPVVLIGDDLGEGAQTRRRLQAVGADAYLPLPFSRGVLMDLIDPLLEQGRLEVKRPDPPAEPSPRSITATDGVLAVPEPEPEVLVERTSLEDLGEVLSELDDMMSPPDVDIDTVVGLENPFYSATAFEVGVGEARVMPPLGSDEPLTPGRAPLAGVVPELGEEPVTSVALGPDPLPRKLERAPSPSTMNILLDPPKKTPTGPVPSQSLQPQPSQSLQPQPSQLPLSQPKRDPLEELPIPGARRSDFPSSERLIQEPPIVQSGSQRRLLHEMPREQTPSESQARAPGQRKGLDESQLGKRLAKRVRTMYRLLDEVDYYQLLGVDRGSSPDAIRTAYFDLSLEFHPDRFFLLRSGDLKEKIYAIFRRLAEAHRVLNDEGLRRLYDESRDGSGKKQVPQDVLSSDDSEEWGLKVDDEAARRFLVLAQAAHGRGDLHGARLFVAIARTYAREHRGLRELAGELARQQQPSI